jgi:hypothetical protein
MTVRLKRFLRGVVLVAATLLGEPAFAALAPDALVDIGVRPPPDAALPLDAPTLITTGSRRSPVNEKRTQLAGG